MYGSDDELLAVAVPFLRGGVDAREPTLLSLPDRELGVVLDAVGDAAGGITVFADHEPLSPLVTLRDRHAMVEQLTDRSALRLLGATPHEPRAAWTWYEAAFGATLAGLPAWGICPFDTRRLPAGVRDDVERTHPAHATVDLAGAPIVAYEDPRGVLERAAALPDPIEREPPDVELADPTAAHAAEIVGVLVDATGLGPHERDSLRLATAALVVNARSHGRPPVTVRVWARPEATVVTVTDAGPGIADVLAGVLPTAGSPDDSGALYHAREALTDVALFRGPDGFTVRLVQR